jgi:hypothetical protein
MHTEIWCKTPTLKTEKEKDDIDMDVTEFHITFMKLACSKVTE